MYLVFASENNPDIRNLPHVLSVAEAAALLRRCPRTVRRLIHRGELQATRVGGTFVIPRSAILRIVRADDRALRFLEPEIDDGCADG